MVKANFAKSQTFINKFTAAIPSAPQNPCSAYPPMIDITATNNLHNTTIII